MQLQLVEEMFIALLASVILLRDINGNSMALPLYEPIGCFRDSGVDPRPLPRLLKNYRPHMNWNDIGTVIQQCAALANQYGYRFFGVQFYGECWSGPDAHATYGRDGVADNCVKGVGAAGVNFVYKFYSGEGKVPGCPIKWIPLSSSCFHVIPDTGDEQTAKVTCQQGEGDLFYTKSDQDTLLMRKLIETMEINKTLNSTACLLLGDWKLNVTVFPDWCDQVNVSLQKALWFNSLNSTHTCAVRASDRQWYRHSCQFDTCSPTCTAPRDISPKDGGFTQRATDAVLKRHVIAKLLVKNPIECARECLLYVNCKSFNFQYAPSSVRRQPYHFLTCELNNDVWSDVLDDFISLDGYKYYERLA